MVFFRLNTPEGVRSIDWDSDRIVSDAFVPCPKNENHPRKGRIRINDLYVVLPSSSVSDVMKTWHSEFIVSERVAEAMALADLTGYELREVVITRVRRNKKDVPCPRLWELRVTGWGGLAKRESGIRMRYSCPDCGYSMYSSLTKPSDLLDADQWDGSDFFMVWPLPRMVFVSERTREVFRFHKLTGATFTPINELKPIRSSLSPGRLWYYMDKDRAFKIGGPLGIE